MHERWDARKEGGSKGGMQERRDAEREEGRKGGRKERRHSGLRGYRKEEFR